MLPDLRIVGDTVMASRLLTDEEVLVRLRWLLGSGAGDWVVPNRPATGDTA